ncbi:MAG TPA: type II toxin-antitoxin system PemK/MazF family toxin [Pilimelia sp.]|nr:type II toxin-antitoxin system PemK/MazF family toxin [Pilimelia sp.]
MAHLWRGVAAAVGRAVRRGSAAVRARPLAGRVVRRAEPAGLQDKHLVYAPEPDGRADPGEIVWTRVPYEEDPRQGKDRPVLIVGRDRATLFGLMLSSQRERDGQRHWFALGPGDWDRENRPSWVRLDRVLTMTEDGIRREGAVLDKARFDAVCRALRAD